MEEKGRQAETKAPGTVLDSGPGKGPSACKVWPSTSLPSPPAMSPTWKSSSVETTLHQAECFLKASNTLGSRCDLTALLAET